MVTFEIFEERMTDLADYLDVSINGNILKEKYYPKFARFDSFQIDKIIKWIEDNYKHEGGKHFPLIPDFKKAIAALTVPTTYKPIKEAAIDNEEYSKDIRILIDKFKITDGKDIPKTKQIKLMLTMLHDNKVYSVKLEKWIDESLKNNTGGLIIDPRQKLESAYIGAHKRF